MKITFISDTHNLHDNVNISPCQILVHNGDFTSSGKVQEIKDFLKWFLNQPADYRILVAGNKDLLFEKKPDWLKDYLSGAWFATEMYYLENDSIIIHGIKFYGYPISPTFSHGWAFNANRGEPIKKYWDKIPGDTDILITHCPPQDILDFTTYKTTGENVGCYDLLQRVKQIKPLVHSFGHIHDSYGIKEDRESNTVFINASICDERYNPTNAPITVEINDQKEIIAIYENT